MNQVQQQDHRQRMYRLLQVAHREMKSKIPDWDDDDYRHVLKTHGAKIKDGRYSAATMNMVQLDNALQHFKDLGFKVKRKNKTTWRAARIAKLNALWCAMADAGAINDRSEQAMRRWCENQVADLTKLEWATSQQLNRAIEMLKAYQERVMAERTAELLD